MPQKLKKSKEAEKILAADASDQQSVQYQFTEPQKQKVVDQILRELEYEESSREEFMSIRAESMRLFEGIREPKSDPWEGCSNVTTMLAAAHVKLMHARLFPAVWNPDLLYWRPVERADIDNVDSVKKFMKWAVKNDIKMQPIIDDATLQGLVDGTIVFKVRWAQTWKWIATRVPKGFGFFGKKRFELKHEYKKFEKPEVDLIEIEDYIQSGPDAQRCSYILHSTYNVLSDLRAQEKSGLLLRGSVTDELQPEIDEMVKGGSREVKEEAEGYSKVEAMRETRPIRTVERYGKWEVNGEMVESVFRIAVETGTYLSGKPLTAVNMIGRRPFVVGPLIRRGGRVYGQSIVELLRGLQKEIDAIHNQRIDAGTISIAPFGVYRAASSFKPETIKIGPGYMIPVDDIKDVNFVQAPANFGFSFQEERLIVEYIEKLTVTSSYSFGRESDIVKSRATATSTLALLGQSDQAFTILGLRLQEIFSNLMTMILQYYQMYMPPGLSERVLGEDAGGKLDLLFKEEGLRPETIAGNYDAYMELDVSGGNKAVEQQTAQIIFQQAPVLLQLTQDPRGWEITANFLRKMGEIDIERYIGPKPQKGQIQQEGAEQPENEVGTELTEQPEETVDVDTT